MNEVRLISSVREVINRTSVHRGQKQRREEQGWNQSRTRCTCSDRKLNWKGNLQQILSSWRRATTAPCLCCVWRAKTHCNKFQLGKQLLILWPWRATQNLFQLFFHINTVFSLLKLELDKRAGHPTDAKQRQSPHAWHLCRTVNGDVICTFANN